MPGYPDFRRQRDYDQFPALVSAISVARVGTQTHTGLYVGLYESVAGILDSRLAPVQVRFTWRDAAVGGNEVGRRVFFLDPGIPVSGLFRLVNLGPFLDLSFFPVTEATAWTQTTVVWPSDRRDMREATARDSVVLDRTRNALGAGTQDTTMFFEYAAGAATVYCLADDQVGLFRIQTELGYGIWTTVWGENVAAGAHRSFNCTLPPGACRGLINNISGAAGDYTMAVTLSPSGAT